MAKQKPSPTLEQNPYVGELLDVLKKHNSPGAEDLRAMLGNAAKIEAQLAAAIVELAAMRRELAAIREDNHPLRKVLTNTVNALQEQIRTLREQLDTLKAAIIEGCKNALTAFKERGAAALDNLAKFFKVRPALEQLAGTLEQAEQRNARAIVKIETISAEYHKAGLHLRNMGRAIAGKDPLPDPKPAGKAAAAISAPFKAVRACVTAARYRTQEALTNLDKLEKAAVRPAPIKAQYDMAAKEAAAHNNARNAPDRTKPVPAAEL
jgi:chromosome segregation ATPase